MAAVFSVLLYLLAAIPGYAGGIINTAPAPADYAGGIIN